MRYDLSGIIMADDVNLALLQMAVKTQEFLIVASTRTIVFNNISVCCMAAAFISVSSGLGFLSKTSAGFGPPVSRDTGLPQDWQEERLAATLHSGVKNPTLEQHHKHSRVHADIKLDAQRTGNRRIGSIRKKSFCSRETRSRC